MEPFAGTFSRFLLRGTSDVQREDDRSSGRSLWERISTRGRRPRECRFEATSSILKATTS